MHHLFSSHSLLHLSDSRPSKSVRWQSSGTGSLHGLVMSVYEPTIRDRVRIALASPPPRLIDQLVRINQRLTKPDAFMIAIYRL